MQTLKLRNKILLSDIATKTRDMQFKMTGQGNADFENKK